MRTIAILLLSTAMIVTALSAFASTGVSNATSLNPKTIRQWIGKSASQLISTFGSPSYTSDSTSGRMVYDYVVNPQHVGAIPTYEFVIGRDGNVASVTTSY